MLNQAELDFIKFKPSIGYSSILFWDLRSVMATAKKKDLMAHKNRATSALVFERKSGVRN
jgi:hypothetical protein